MASSSSSCVKGSYDVFLSFRGKDIRKNFLGHLYTALKKKGIYTFRDDERLERGKSIAPGLNEAIDDSKIAIVVFSKNYADSSWCLDELVRIVKEREQEKMVIPVFYDVEPADVRWQENGVGEALAKLGHESADKLQGWKEALIKASNFSGWAVRKTADGNESECIKEIVTDVLRKLNRLIPNVYKDLVGLESRVDEVLSMLRVEESETIRRVGIWGMGGAGKTTTARAVFDKLRHSYNEGSCFLKIASGKGSDEEYLIYLQKTLLSKTLNSHIDEIDISHTRGGVNLIKERLGYKKVLIVLDNVERKQQLDALVGMGDEYLFGPGSLIIITTRDNRFLNKVNGSYEVELLNNIEAMQLFSWHAFDKRSQPYNDFVDLSHQVVEYAKGLPLALKVLGSHLNGLSQEEWKSEIRKLLKIPHGEILSVLKVSYDGLDDTNKSIFLDFACFFRGIEAGEVIRILDSFELYFETGIRPLVRKSLVYVEDGILEMHDLVRAMGKNVVGKSHPGSRLWEEEQIVDVLDGEMECVGVEGIVLMSPEYGDFSINSTFEGLKKMKRLRLLCLSSNVHYSIAPEYLSNQLQWLEWYKCPWDSFPSSFQGRKLVGLMMQRSCIVQPITGEQRFDKLRIMDLCGSEEIRQSPDFTKVPSLEELNLKFCNKLEVVHSSFGLHKKLRSVDLSYCTNLVILPETLQMESLKSLNLQGCRKLEIFPEIEGNMACLVELNLSETGITQTPDFSKVPCLEALSMHKCDNLVEIHSSFGVHKKLQFVDFSWCYNLNVFPESLQMESLKRLDLSNCRALENFPTMEANTMTCLEELNLLQSGIPRLPSSIKNLAGLRVQHEG